MAALLSGAAALPQRFLVTTSHSVLLIEPSSKQVEIVHTGAGLYYGIDVSSDRVLIAARNRMVSSTAPVSAEKGEILVFDSNLMPSGKIEADFSLRDLHQIRFHAGHLYATCSYDNVVAILCPDGRWWEWQPLKRPAAEPWDVNHFNTLEMIDGRLCVLAHNHGSSEILVFDPLTRELTERISLGVQAHNIWKAGEEWRVCSSAEGRLVGSLGFNVETGGFPRGVWVGDGGSIVGISVFSGREKRDSTDCQLVIYGADWKECNRITLPGQGMILDIAAFPAEDGASQ